MRHALAIAVLANLVPMAAAQSGAKVTIPPHSHQSRAVQFANICPSVETFKVSAQPETDWLRFEPTVVDAQPGTSFEIRITADSGNHAAGRYRSAVKVFCASCAASDPPCFESIAGFPIELTVANVALPGRFEEMFDGPNPAATKSAASSQSTAPRRPAPYIPPDPQPRPGNRWIAVVGGGLLLVGLSVMVLAIYALTSGRKLRPAIGEMGPAESQRHQVRR